MEKTIIDESFLRDLFYRNYRSLYFLARGYLADGADIEDIVSESFVKLWQNRDSLARPEAAGAYLQRTVRNACIDHCRGRVRGAGLDSIDEAAVARTLADIGEDPMDYLITRELEQAIEQAIGSLPARYRETFELSRFHDLTYEEIARRMDISVNTVKSNLREALAALRKSLGVLLIIFRL